MSRRRNPPSRKPRPRPGKAALRRFLATCTPEEERELLAEICALVIEQQELEQVLNLSGKLSDLARAGGTPR